MRRDRSALLAQTLPACRSSTTRYSASLRAAAECRFAVCSSRRLPVLFRALTPKLPAASNPRGADSHRSYRGFLHLQVAHPKVTISGSLPELSFALQRLRPSEPLLSRERGLRGCQVPQEPAPSVFSLSASRASTPVHICLPGLFHPGNALELSPSGLCSARRFGSVSVAGPPLPFRDALCRRTRLRRFSPPRRELFRANPLPSSALLAFSPLRLSLSPP